VPPITAETQTTRAERAAKCKKHSHRRAQNIFSLHRMSDGGECIVMQLDQIDIHHKIIGVKIVQDVEKIT
jgi:hypothetical protein